MFARLILLIAQWSLYGLLSYNLEDLYGYAGVAYDQPSAEAVLLSIGALALVAALLPSSVALPSQASLWLLASFVVIPTLSVATSNPNYASGVSRTAVLIVMVGFLIVALSMRKPVTRRRFASVQRLSDSDYIAIVSVVTLVAMLTVVLGFGVKSFDLSLDEELERRLAARIIAAPFPGAFYLVTWLKAVLVPLLLVLSIKRRAPRLAILSLVGTALIFSFTGEKSAMVYPLLALLLLLSVQRSTIGDLRPWFGVLLTGLIGLPMLLTSIFPSSGMDALITRRFGLIPGQLTHTYVEYVDSFGFTWFSQSFLRLTASGDDTLSMGARVGQWLDSTGELNANAHIWADGFGSAGLLGVVLVSVLLVIVLRILDVISMSRDSSVATPLLGTVGFAFVNGYFHTSLLTDGVLFAALLVWLMPFQRASERLQVDNMPGKSNRQAGKTRP